MRVNVSYLAGVIFILWALYVITPVMIQAGDYKMKLNKFSILPV